MKAKCPKNPKHNRFVTVAHVAEDWVVNAEGHFIKVVKGNQPITVHGPHPDNTWRCLICGTEAEVTP